MSVDINREIDLLGKIPTWGQYLSNALRLLSNGTNQLATNVGASPTDILPAPPAVQQLTVKSNGAGLVHAVINDANPIQKGLHYFVEYANEPTFLQPHVVHLGASRSMPITPLPAFDDHMNPQVWYFRAYSQYPGSHPGPKVLFGGNNATSVNPGGTQAMTLLPSTGSGTAQNSGQEGGSGFGKNLYRGRQ